jgi:hypothetical protein
MGGAEILMRRVVGGAGRAETLMRKVVGGAPARTGLSRPTEEASVAVNFGTGDESPKTSG